MKRWLLVVLITLAAAFAWPMQGPGDNENSHYALVKALARGTPEIDETRGEVGDRGTIDVATHRGHYYSNKAPGFAFLLVAPYVALREVGVATTGDPTRMLWALGLVGTVLPALALVLLVGHAADRVASGFGTAAALALALGTLVLPFATVFHSHVLAALLPFAGFVALWAREGAVRSLRWVVAGGVLAGLSIAVEYANAIVAVVLAAYAVAHSDWVRRGAAYAGGLAVGVLPLALYNAWAFGSPTHVSYSNALPTQGSSTSDLIGRAHPSAAVLLETLFSTTGLLVLSPVLVLGVVGGVAMFRAGYRREALVVAAVSAGFLAYNSSFGSELDAYPGGQRYLVPMLGFAALPLAPALKRLPATWIGLAIVSAVLMLALTLHVRSGDPDWFGPIAERRFPRTAAELLGVTGWYAVVPFFAAAVVAVAAAFLATRRPRVRSVETLLGGSAVLAWAALAAISPDPLGGSSAGIATYVPQLLCLASVGAVAHVALRGGLAGQLAARASRLVHRQPRRKANLRA